MDETNCIPAWLDLLLEPFILILLAAAGYYWGHHIWRKQKKEEGKYLIDQERFQAKLEACKAAWGLIIYFSENDNEKNVLERGPLAGNGEKILYFRKKESQQFFMALHSVFYEEGHGIFLPKEIKQRLFHVRGHFMGLYLSSLKSDPDKNKVEIRNADLINNIVEIRNELMVLLKEEVKDKKPE